VAIAIVAIRVNFIFVLHALGHRNGRIRSPSHLLQSVFNRSSPASSAAFAADVEKINNIRAKGGRGGSINT
jgi:hypothetical protein